MDEFDKQIELVEKNYSSEIHGQLKDYFTVSQNPNGRYKLVWEKPISTHIRHKVTALVKKHFVATSI